MNLKRISIIAFIILALAVGYLVLTGSLLAHGPVAIAVQVLAVLLMLWARITFRARSFHAGADPTSGGLVTTGPYRYLRHPIYVAVLLFTLAGVLTNLTLASALAELAVIAATVTRMISEERLLLLRYPEYAAYARQAKRFIPFIY